MKIKVKIKHNQEDGYTIKIKHDNVFQIIKLIDSFEHEYVKFFIDSDSEIIENYLKSKEVEYKRVDLSNDKSKEV